MTITVAGMMIRKAGDTLYELFPLTTPYDGSPDVEVRLVGPAVNLKGIAPYVPPTIVEPPQLSGTLFIGGTVQADRGAATGYPDPIFDKYFYEKNGVLIENENGSSFSLAGFVEGDELVLGVIWKVIVDGQDVYLTARSDPYTITEQPQLTAIVSRTTAEAGQAITLSFNTELSQDPTAFQGTTPLTPVRVGTTNEWTVTPTTTAPLVVSATAAGHKPYSRTFAAAVLIEIAVDPNPPIQGQAVTFTFNPTPSSITSNIALSGSGNTRTGTAGTIEIAVTASAAGYLTTTQRYSPVPQNSAPSAEGGEIQWDGNTVTLVPPAATGGYPEPTRTLQSLTVAGVNRLADLDGEDLHGVQVSASSQVVSATWLFSNGVSPNKTVTRTYTIPAAAITATVEPALTRLYAGQTPAAITNLATLTNAANYSSTGGTIVSAQLQVNGAAATSSTALAVGDHLSVLVTDDDGTTRRWTLSTVEYVTQIVPDAGGTTRAVEVNDLIPAGQTVSVTWEGVTTTTTKTALAAGPVNHIPPAIEVVDGTYRLIQDSHRWINAVLAGVPTYAYQWRRNGTAISGATGTSYTPGASDAGTTTTIAVTATDTNGTSAPAVSNGIANAAAQPTGISYLTRAHSTTTGTSRTFPALDLGAADPSRDIIVLASTNGIQNATLTGVTVGGVAATQIVGVPSGNGIAYASAWKARVPAGATGDVVVSASTASVGRVRVALYRGVNVSVSDTGSAGVANSNSVTASVDAAAAGHKLVGYAVQNNGTTATWTGGAEIFDEAPTDAGSFHTLAEGMVPAGGAASMTVARDSGGGQIALIVFAAG